MFRKRTLILPVAMIALAAVAQTTPPAVLSWTAPTLMNDNITPIVNTITYNVYQGASGAEKFLAGGVPSTGYTISTAFTGTQCWYVTAVVLGVESAASGEVCKTSGTVASTKPNPPGGLVVK